MEKKIFFVINEEAEKFLKTIEKGTIKFEKIYNQKENITPQDAFELFTTFGFPLDVTQDLSDKKNIKINQNEFDILMKKHREISKKGADKKFNSGLSDNTEEVVRYHTTTHILHKTLKELPISRNLPDSVFGWVFKSKNFFAVYSFPKS